MCLAVPSGLVIVLKPNPRLRPIGANLFGMFFSKLPQNRHPERSASEICRATRRLVARSRRTPRVLILSMPFVPFQTPKPPPGGPATVFPRGREQELGASCYVLRPHLHSRQPSLGKSNSKAGVAKRSSTSFARSQEEPCTRAWVVGKLRTAATR